MKDLNGIHHVTAMTSSAERIYDFFTYILGVRLVKKTINQDDIHTYHLFFADDEGQAGTDMTFFDFPGNPKAIKGTDEIAKTGFRVPSDAALRYWLKRFDKYQVEHSQIKVLFGVKYIDFTDFDGQEYALFSDQFDQGVAPGIPWQKGPVPNEYGIRGLGPIFLRVSQPERITRVLEQMLTFRLSDSTDNLMKFETGLGGNGTTVIVEISKDLSPSRQGYGGIHHIAFGVDDKQDISAWIKRLNQLGARHSGLVDRFYFKSLYTRLYPNLLFEFATMGPGFIDDEESYETLGETLALPPKFRHLRKEIESMVRFIDTKRSHLEFKKEYLEEVDNG